jgi:hypothetical protein
MTTTYTKRPQNIPNSYKVDKLSINYTNFFHCKTLQNLPKLGFLVWKYAIWQPWSASLPLSPSSPPLHVFFFKATWVDYILGEWQESIIGSQDGGKTIKIQLDAESKLRPRAAGSIKVYRHVNAISVTGILQLLGTRLWFSLWRNATLVNFVVLVLGEPTNSN